MTPMTALALLSTLQSAAIALPTTDGREIRLRRITEPVRISRSCFACWASTSRSVSNQARDVVQTLRQPKLILKT
jgi:hypothetical protein